MTKFVRTAMKVCAATVAWLAVALAVPIAPVDAEPRFHPRFEPMPCRWPLPDGWTDGVNVRCGEVLVPTWHDEPERGVIRVAVAIFESTADHPDKEPVLYLAGGPSSNAGLQTDRVVPALTSSRDVIVMDQRGVEFSTPSLLCTEAVAQAVTDLEALVPANQQVANSAAAFLACRDRFLAEGVDLAAFNLDETVQDVGDVATALGYNKIALYGVSFGSHISVHAMREFPNRIRATIVNSGWAPDQSQFAGGLVDRIRETIWDLCEADPACSAAFPGVRDLFTQLRQQFDAAPITVPYTLDGVTHTALLDGNRFASAIGPTPDMPRIVWQVAHGYHSVLSPLVVGLLGINNPRNTNGAHMSMQCPRAIRSWGSAPPPPNNLYGLVCPHWPTVPEAPVFTEPASTPIPTLVIHGDLDATIPIEQGAILAAQLPHGTFVGLHGLIHGFPADANPCILAIQQDFLRHPHHQPDASCVADVDLVFPGTA